eukprot:TRINITY_DN2740_c0_g2_i5.p1 TRINITY_DN2740_c0_g2~~TRINITY_DN2740_c0_g2_i5.p1  ORF type:complete len:131 (-),score=1.59 TRINITY_DN2740_c0_g2_i5:118-510(-)
MFYALIYASYICYMHDEYPYEPTRPEVIFKSFVEDVMIQTRSTREYSAIQTPVDPVTQINYPIIYHPLEKTSKRILCKGPLLPPDVGTCGVRCNTVCPQCKVALHEGLCSLCYHNPLSTINQGSTTNKTH